MKTLKYGLVGDGRLSRHLAHYLKSLGQSVSVWSRRQPETPEAFLHSDIFLIAVSDDALPSILDELERLWDLDLRATGKPLVHFSGALSIAEIAGFHPLQSFGPTLYPLEEYAEIAFVCEEGAPWSFSEVFPELPNPSFELNASAKARYHAECVMAGNFTSILWKRFFRYLESELGVSSSAALPYLARIARNLAQNPADAVTGPLARKDRTTVARNLAALGMDEARLYKAFVALEAPELMPRGRIAGSQPIDEAQDSDREENFHGRA